MELCDKKLLKIAEVMELTGLAKATVFDKINKGTFPKPLKIGRLARWTPETIDKWIDSLTTE